VSPMLRTATLSGAALLGLIVCSCTGTARVYPLNDAAGSGVMPKITFVKQGLGRGPMTVTMPDGVTLQGEYQVTENASLGFAFARGVTATGVGLGSGATL
jgi:hypothetical protein